MLAKAMSFQRQARSRSLANGVLPPQQFGVSIPQIFLKRGFAELALVLCCARRLEATSASAPRCLRMMVPFLPGQLFPARLVPREGVWTARWAARLAVQWATRSATRWAAQWAARQAAQWRARWAVHWAAQ